MEKKNIPSPLGRALALIALLLLVLTTPTRANETASDACATETAALQLDSAVQGALNDMRQSITSAMQEDFFQFCSILQRACTVDLSEYSTSLPTACADAGGQIANQTAPIGLECQGKVLGIPIPGGVEVRFENLPTCVGPTCDPDNLPLLVEETVRQLLNEEVEPVIENNLQDGNCTSLESSAKRTLSWAVSLAASGLSTCWLISCF